MLNIESNTAMQPNDVMKNLPYGNNLPLQNDYLAKRCVQNNIVGEPVSRGLAHSFHVDRHRMPYVSP